MVCTSDADWKRDNHGRERAAVRAALHHGDEMPLTRELCDVYDSDKDGKTYSPEWAKD